MPGKGGKTAAGYVETGSRSMECGQTRRQRPDSPSRPRARSLDRQLKRIPALLLEFSGWARLEEPFSALRLHVVSLGQAWEAARLSSRNVGAAAGRPHSIRFFRVPGGERINVTP